jgi:hypothetical protein
MITSYDIPYYLIFASCFAFSLAASKDSIPGLMYLRLLLFAGLVTEVTVEILQWLHKEENGPYHVYIPVEYILLVLFYVENTSRARLPAILKLSIPIYVLSSLGLSYFYYHFSSYPSLIYNFSCLLNVIWIVHLIFEINPSEHTSLTQLPLFWIFSSLLIFYSGIFFFNGAYNYLISRQAQLASMLRTYINICLNYLLYLLLIYAFICSIRMKKYSTRSS